MTGIERRKERKKEGIMRAALELFQEFGFDKVSLNEIALRAGVSHVTIYNYFGSREELIRDVIKNLSLNMIEKYRAIIKEDKPYLERLESIVLDKADVISQFQGELLQSVIRNDPEIQHFIESAYQGEIMPMILEFFEEGKKEGHINAELSPESFMVYMDIILKGMNARSRLAEGIEHNPKLVRDLMSLIAYGLNG